MIGRRFGQQGRDVASRRTDDDARQNQVPQRHRRRVYAALVDTFAHDSFVLFGAHRTKPGGSVQSDDTISVGDEPRGRGRFAPKRTSSGCRTTWSACRATGTRPTQLYTKTPSPITHDNVIYELHYYPGGAGETPNNYQYSSTLPMIVGEYGYVHDAGAAERVLCGHGSEDDPEPGVGLRSVQRVCARSGERDPRRDDADADGLGHQREDVLARTREVARVSSPNLDPPRLVLPVRGPELALEDLHRARQRQRLGRGTRRSWAPCTRRCSGGRAR